MAQATYTPRRIMFQEDWSLSGSWEAAAKPLSYSARSECFWNPGIAVLVWPDRFYKDCDLR